MRVSHLFRQRLSCALLVLHVVLVHGLPALHLAWHRDDHVHTASGLRWLPSHRHDSAAPRSASTVPPMALAPSRGPSSHLYAATDLSGPAALLQLATGQGHAQQALLLPAGVGGVVPAAPVDSFYSSARRFCSGDLVTVFRARAPPRSV